jgi:hypothetical protein
MQWLRSADAIQAHAVFPLLIGLLTSDLLAGNWGPGGDYPLALVFCIVTYPVILLLLWVKWRINGRSEF